MTVEFFNLPYLVFVFIGAGSLIGLYYLLRDKSEKTKKIVIFSLLMLNLLIHLLKLTIPPYNESLQVGLRNVFAVNICAVSVFVFPFIFLSKNEGAKDFMYYLGSLSGGLALLIPDEVLGDKLWTFDTFRFYIAHTLIMLAPVLMVMLKVHTLNYKRIWKMPVYVLLYFMFIMVNQVFMYEIGIVELVDPDNFLTPSFRNNSFFWGKSNSELFAIFDWATPKF